MSSNRSVSRRSMLRAGLAVSVTGALAPSATAAAATPRRDAADVTRRLARLEERHGARLGVYGRNTRTGASVSYRAGERFAMCSSFKGILAAQVLRDFDRNGEFLDRVVTYTKDDLVDWSIITENFTDTGMTVRNLCAAAVCYSDNGATNLLLKEVGGPRAFTRFCRAVGDPSTRLDRIEPDMSEAVPGDPRDTTTPAAIAGTYARLMLGSALAPRDRDLLTVWMKGNTTSANRFYAALPGDWVIADKTGTGGYGTVNDLGVVWTSRGTPLVLSVLTTHDAEDAPADEDLLVRATRILREELAPHE